MTRDRRSRTPKDERATFEVEPRPLHIVCPGQSGEGALYRLECFAPDSCTACGPDDAPREELNDGKIGN